MQISKTKRVSNYSLDFMIICLAENIIEHCKHRLQRIVIVTHVRTIILKLLIILLLHAGT